MRNKKKLDFQSRKIKSLEATVKELKTENLALEKENSSLRNLNDAYKNSSEVLNSDLKNIMERYKKNLDEVYDLKIKYEESIRETEKLRKEYKDKMGILLQRLRKQTR